jgi:opacity protein-like surface antigen
MKGRLIIAAILSTFIATSIAAAGQFGAPQPVANPNGFALGVGYFYSNNLWEPQNNTLDRDWKMTRNEVYIQASGATKYIEGYVRLGGANMNLEDGKGIGNDFEDSGVIFGSVGARGIYPITPNFGIGPVFQASLYDNFTDSLAGQEIKLKTPWEVGLALAFQGNIGDNLIIYAGPYLFWSGFDVDGGATWETKSNFGAMGGVRFKFNKTFSIEVEGQYTDEFSAGGMFTVSF